jgi:hypothetical protein
MEKLARILMSLAILGMAVLTIRCIINALFIPALLLIFATGIGIVIYKSNRQ